jgi:hypothetical protein
VINRGANGEEVGDMLKRFDESVVAAKPDLVLWQLGTNSVLRDHKLDGHSELIRAGLKKLRAIGSDVVLIDPQYAPRVLAKAEATQTVVQMLARIAKQENVDLFRRYDVMKRWHEVDRIGFDTFVAPDGLHLNDWSYACMANGLGQAIAEAALFSDLTGAFPVADDEPARAIDITRFCAGLLNIPVPPPQTALPGEDTRRANRRVDGRAIRRALGIELAFPSYRVGIPAAVAP